MVIIRCLRIYLIYCKVLEINYNFDIFTQMLFQAYLLKYVNVFSTESLHSRCIQAKTFIQYLFADKFLLCFSALSNTESIFDTTKPRNGSVVPVLDGMRFFSTCWVIVGHSFSELVFGIGKSKNACFFMPFSN